MWLPGTVHVHGTPLSKPCRCLSLPCALPQACGPTGSSPGAPALSHRPPYLHLCLSVRAVPPPAYAVSPELWPSLLGCCCSTFLSSGPSGTQDLSLPTAPSLPVPRTCSCHRPLALSCGPPLVFSQQCWLWPPLESDLHEAGQDWLLGPRWPGTPVKPFFPCFLGCVCSCSCLTWSVASSSAVRTGPLPVSRQLCGRGDRACLVWF